MICSICLRNTQNWNCLSRDYRFGRWSTGRERKERKSSWGHPPTALFPLTSASLQALCQMITLRSPLYAGMVLLIHFQQRKMYASSSPSHCVSSLTRFEEKPNIISHYYPEHPQNKMTKSKRNEIRKKHRQSMLPTHTNKHTNLSSQIDLSWGYVPTFVLNSSQSCLLGTPIFTWLKWVNYQFVNTYFSLFFLLASFFAFHHLF